ncbi:MAG: HAD-IA family hydrolase [Pseudomonadales bacterium]|nr:HAD-IA family hydrolase [Pseudomonadales bacterium]
MNTIRHVFLDADGVVQVPSVRFRDALGELAGDASRAEAFLADVFEAERPCTTGERDFRVELERVLREWSSPVALEDALSVWTLIDPHPSTLSFVEGARRAGYSVALATNQQAHRAAFMTEVLGYRERFDRLFFSCELGVAKPDPAFFEAMVREVGAMPAECLFVDDHPGNVEAARSVGLMAECYHVDDGEDALLRLMTNHGISPA